MRPSRRFWLEWLGAFLLCAAMCAYFQFQTPFLPEEDGYFHIKMAYLMRHHGLFLKGFPWAHFSMWREGFSDGSLVFHLLLMPFTFGDLAFGAKLATSLLSGLMFSSFFAILTLHRVRFRFYWFLLLLLGGGFFWWRMMVPRPQVLSTTLLLWSLHFLLSGRRRAFAAVSFLYPLSYVAAFLPQVFAATRWLYLKIAEKRSEHRILFAGLAAYALGMLLHPYFPKNLKFFYVQNIWVMTLAITQKVDLHLGREILPLDTRTFVAAHVPLLFHLFGLGFIFAHRRVPLSERTRVTFPIMMILLLMACVSKRFLEYAVPVSTLFCAFFFTDLFADYGQSELARDFGPDAKSIVEFLLIVMIAGALTGAGALKWTFSNIQPPRWQAMAKVLAEKVPPGELVYTCDWDDPPQLLFFNDQHRYPVMMDPTFMYYWDPALWRKWSDINNGRIAMDGVYKAMTETFHARFGVCGSKFRMLRAMMGPDERFDILAEDKNGFVFEVL